MNKVDILRAALETRADEVLHYQINIDNYASAIQKIEARYTADTELDRAMLEFRKVLQQLHDSSVIEREKARIMLEVLNDQIGGA